MLVGLNVGFRFQGQRGCFKLNCAERLEYKKRRVCYQKNEGGMHASKLQEAGADERSTPSPNLPTPQAASPLPHCGTGLRWVMSVSISRSMSLWDGGKSAQSYPARQG